MESENPRQARKRFRELLAARNVFASPAWKPLASAFAFESSADPLFRPPTHLAAAITTARSLMPFGAIGLLATSYPDRIVVTVVGFHFDRQAGDDEEWHLIEVNGEQNVTTFRRNSAGRWFLGIEATRT